MEELSVVGKSLPRVDGIEKVSGLGKFTADIKLPRMLEGRLLRSPYAHAKVLDIDTSKAERLPGVKAVLSMKNVPRVLSNWSTFSVISMPPYEFFADQYIFDEKVRYVGDPVAAVAAVNEDVAYEALDLIKIEYKELPSVFDPLDSMDPRAPKIHNKERNIAGQITMGFGDLEKGFKDADYILEDTYETPRVKHCQIEPHVFVANFDETGRLTIWSPSQMPFLIRRMLASLFEMPENWVRVLSSHIGGAFGGRFEMIGEPFTAILSLKTRRPVKVEYTRQEDFYCSPTRHPCIIELKAGIKKDGILTALKSKAIADTGAYHTSGIGLVGVLGITLISMYRCPSNFEGYCVYTNNPIAGAFRGFGNPQATFAREVHLDKMANILGLDPLEIRLKNHVRVGDRAPLGGIIGSCGLEECLKKGSERIGWGIKRTNLNKSSGNKRGGVGVACMIHCSGAKFVCPEYSSALVKINEDGTIGLITGVSDVGQGSRTALAQIAAEELGVMLKDIHVTTADTDTTPFDIGSHADRVTYSAGGTVKRAAADARRQLLEEASSLLEADPRDLDINRGYIYVKGSPEKGIPISQVASTAHMKSKQIIGMACYEPPENPPPFAAQFAEVEVDMELGEVRVLKLVAAHDVGRAINPMAIEGQIQGGIQIGVGYALTEKLISDKRNGKPLNPTFTDYKILAADDMPVIDTIIVESIEPTGPFGAKGIGEGVSIPTAAAIANAVYNAVGISLNELPITPNRVLQTLKEKIKTT